MEETRDGLGQNECDADVKEVEDRATIAGIRDHTEHWIRGYCRNLSCCTVLRAEAWGLLDGLELT